MLPGGGSNQLGGDFLVFNHLRVEKRIENLYPAKYAFS